MQNQFNKHALCRYRCLMSSSAIHWDYKEGFSDTTDPGSQGTDADNRGQERSLHCQSGNRQVSYCPSEWI